MIIYKYITTHTQIDSRNSTNNEDIKTTIKDSTATANDKVQSAIIAFQFYNKLSQRLDHVSNTSDSSCICLS